MAVFIYDPNALELMGKLEGPEWLADQAGRTASPYHFPLWLEAWNLKVAAGHERDDHYLSEYVQDRFDLSISPVIYGKGGFHRYPVMDNGEIRFSRYHALPKGVQWAQDLGFTIC